MFFDGRVGYLYSGETILDQEERLFLLRQITLRQHASRLCDDGCCKHLSLKHIGFERMKWGNAVGLPRNGCSRPARYGSQVVRLFSNNALSSLKLRQNSRHIGEDKGGHEILRITTIFPKACLFGTRSLSFLLSSSGPTSHSSCGMDLTLSSSTARIPTWEHYHLNTVSNGFSSIREFEG